MTEVKVVKAGSLVYEDGGFMLYGWEFDQADGSVSDRIDAALIFIVRERINGLGMAKSDQYTDIRALNAERIMHDAIQQAKK